jgi:hypothetical protein
MKQDMKFTTREKRYGTEEIAAILGYWKLRLAPLGEWDEWQKLSDDRFVDAVVARLRAADKTEKLYHELLYEVARKFPNETRHETARRYIRKAEIITHEQANAIADYEGKED